MHLFGGHTLDVTVAGDTVVFRKRDTTRRLELIDAMVLVPDRSGFKVTAIGQDALEQASTGRLVRPFREAGTEHDAVETLLIYGQMRLERLFELRRPSVDITWDGWPSLDLNQRLRLVAAIGRTWANITINQRALLRRPRWRWLLNMPSQIDHVALAE